ncbi:MAG TPA: cellulose biosynthesis protein BcsS [Pseudolabrys sp.]
MSAAIIVAAAFSVCCVCVSAGPIWAGDDGAQFLLFSGADLWRDGRFLHGGLLWSPGGLDREGFTLKLMGSGGVYRYSSGALGNATVIGTEEEGQLLPGWRFKRDRLEVKVFAGLNIKNDVTSPNDPSSRLHGTAVGVRTTVNLWFEPTPTTMIAADASLTTIATGYSARGAYGWRLNDWFYLGPEAQTFACVGYSQLRFGAHLTALKTAQWEWSAAAGWAGDNDHRSSLYLRLGVLTRQ